MATDRGSKQTLAREAWQPLARYFFDTVRQRQRILAAYGLTPNDMRALATLDTETGRLAERRTVPGDRRVKSVVLTSRGAKTRDRVLHAMFEPPPELLELDRADLVAIRDAVARLPITPFGMPVPRRRSRTA
jgi:DNA-binding MarR family transcriptional regulator